MVDTDGGDDDVNHSFALSAQSQNHHLSLDVNETIVRISTKFYII